MANKPLTFCLAMATAILYPKEMTPQRMILTNKINPPKVSPKIMSNAAKAWIPPRILTMLTMGR